MSFRLYKVQEVSDFLDTKKGHIDEVLEEMKIRSTYRVAKMRDQEYFSVKTSKRIEAYVTKKGERI
jgi:hypothetical protein